VVATELAANHDREFWRCSRSYVVTFASGSPRPSTLTDMDPTDAEREAIKIRFHLQHPEAPADEGPTPEQADILLEEIRERERAIETSALMALRNATYNQPSRSGMNSKYMQVFIFFVICPVAALFLLAEGVMWLLNALHAK